MNVWFIDDREQNRATWLASFPSSVHEACSLVVFESVPDFLTAIDSGERPDVVFIDFFIDGHYGLEVIERMTAKDVPVPLLVAHSSMSEANDGMVRAGAHLAMEKVKGVAKSLSIVEAIGGPEDLRRMIREHLGDQAAPGTDPVG